MTGLGVSRGEKLLRTRTWRGLSGSRFLACLLLCQGTPISRAPQSGVPPADLFCVCIEGGPLEHSAVQMGPIEFSLCGGVPGSDPGTRTVSAPAGKSTE
jgi:hypothetical protein